LVHKPDLVITEKGVSDLASHYLMKAGVTCIRRVRKTDNLRIARVCGATIVNRTDEIQDTDIGSGCGLFEIRKFGDEFFMFLEQCKDPKACTILLRGGSKDILMELERNLQDAMQVARNVVFEPKLLPGGGAAEMSIAVGLVERSKQIEGVEAWPFRAVASALEVIPRTIAQNCGSDVVRTMTELRASKAGGANANLGIDGDKGTLRDMAEAAIFDPFVVRTQVIKSAVESACLLLRIDDILSGIKNKKYDNGPSKQPAEDGEEGPVVGEE
jgi:T-complex protein 1 subunit gamma